MLHKLMKKFVMFMDRMLFIYLIRQTAANWFRRFREILM